LFASMLAATLMLASGALTQPQPAVDGAADRYIVVLEEDVDHPSRVAGGIEQQQELEVGFVYSNALEGFSAEIPEEDLAAVRANPQVDYVERDRLVHTVDQTLPWGINRIDADKSTTAAIDGVGEESNVRAYIIDTGIDANHADLNVGGHINFVGDGKNYDCNGHGTHVAGTVAAKDNGWGVVGVAPDAPLIGVKVIGCNGSGSLSNVIKGVDWVTAKANELPFPAIANLSLSTGASRAFDYAVRKSANSGVFYAVAAGNYDRSACKYSPARAGLALRDTNGDGKIGYKDSNGIVTTAAIDKSNEESSFSNYGRCVDLWAPGRKILSTKLGGGTTAERGTSMAAPHVGGTGALYLSSHTGAASATVEKTLKADSRVTSTKSKDGRLIRLVNASGY
jgi:subtilisin family serine protease